MKEVKTPKKPLVIYYAIVLLLLLLLNVVLVPWMNERQIKEVDYGTFMSMTEEKNIGKVDIESNQIIFTDKDNTQVYKTGLMDDSGLTERLYTAGAEFSSEIVEQGSPVLSFLIWFVLPIILFTALGNYMNKKLMDKMGGPNSMMFGGMGKSNAKVYVQKETGKGLSTNDYTTAEKTKLGGIEEGANKYTHPTHTAAASGLYKVTVDALGHVTATTKVVKNDITGLGIPAQDTTYTEVTQSANGLMTASDKTKLDGMTIATDAEVTEMLTEVFGATA